MEVLGRSTYFLDRLDYICVADEIQRAGLTLVIGFDRCMHRSDPQNETDRLKVFLKRADQLALATIVLACASVFVIYVVVDHRSRNGLVDIDTAPRKNVQYMVNINQANWPELANLPGIGENLARAIVERREQFGEFETIDQLMEIRGIGERKIEAIKPYVSLSDDTQFLVRQ